MILASAQILRPGEATSNAADESDEKRDAGRVRIANRLALPPSFSNVTLSANILTETSGTHGASVADIDGDTYPDIYVCSQEDYKIPQSGYKGNYLFRNNGDWTFSRIEAAAGVEDIPSYAHASLFFDMDHDGDFDLAVGHGLDGLLRRGLFRNNGNLTFTQVDATCGFANAGDTGTRSIIAGDMNGDGLHDIHFSSFDRHDTEGYLGDGHGTFTRKYGLNDRDRAIQGLTMADLDGDGDLDVLMGSYTSNDGIAYYQNDGRGQFIRVLGTGLPEVGSASTANVADVNGDGRLDVLITPEKINRSDLYLSSATRYVFSQSFPTMPDTNCTDSCGNSNGVFGDFEHDGDLDLLLPAAIDKVWLNDGQGTFVPLRDAESGILFTIQDARFPALLDYDGDGDLDVLITQHDGPAFLFRNNTNDRQWIKIESIGPLGERGAFGTKVWAYEEGYLKDPAHLKGYAEAMASGGYCIQNEPVLHFGLGNRASADLHVQFLNGKVLDIPSVPAGEFLQLLGAAAETLRVLEGFGTPGSTGNSVMVELVNTCSLSALQFSLTPVPNYLRPSAVHTTTRTRGFSASIDSTGKVELTSASGDALLSGSGPVAEILYDHISASDGRDISLLLSNAKLLSLHRQVILPVTLVGSTFRVSSPLPVELTSFAATAGNGRVRLQWSTVTDTGNQVFFIERSDCASDFMPVAFVRGAGTTTSSRSYHYTDGPLLPGKYCYRLQQLDGDGSTSYSSIVQVILLPPMSYSIEQNYPNPLELSAASSETRIVYHLHQRSLVALVLYDLLGRELKALVKEEQGAGTHQVSWDGRDESGRALASGIYLYSLSAGGFRATRKLVVIR